MRTERGSVLRAATGALLSLHGLAHARSGLWAAELGRWWAPGPGETRLGSLMLGSLWTLALAGFLVSALGAWNVWPFRYHWRLVAVCAAIASLALLLAAWPPGAATGLALDALILFLLWKTRRAGWSLPTWARVVNGSTGAEDTERPSEMLQR